MNLEAASNIDKLSPKANIFGNEVWPLNPCNVNVLPWRIGSSNTSEGARRSEKILKMTLGIFDNASARRDWHLRRRCLRWWRKRVRRVIHQDKRVRSAS